MRDCGVVPIPSTFWKYLGVRVEAEASLGAPPNHSQGTFSRCWGEGVPACMPRLCPQPCRNPVFQASQGSPFLGRLWPATESRACCSASGSRRAIRQTWAARPGAGPGLCVVGRLTALRGPSHPVPVLAWFLGALRGPVGAAGGFVGSWSRAPGLCTSCPARPGPPLTAVGQDVAQKGRCHCFPHPLRGWDAIPEPDLFPFRTRTPVSLVSLPYKSRRLK